MSKRRDLFEAVERGDLVKLNKLLARWDVDKNWVDAAKDTVLIRASVNGHLNIVDRLLQAGAAKNRHGQFGCTALTRASENGHLGVVDKLLLAGAEVDKSGNMFGDTALTLAAGKGHVEVVDRLLTAGANINGRDGRTALISAAACGQAEVVRRLLQVGADIDKRNNTGETALIRATAKDHLQVVKILIQAGADINKQNQEGKTALMIAAEKDLWDIILQLLLVDVDRTKITPERKTAYDLAKSDTVRLILKTPAAVGAQLTIDYVIVKGLATTTRVQARREWMQRRDALQAQYDAAEKALAYTECARLMKGIAVHEQQSESILPSVEDYRTLADRHRRVVTAVEEKCKQLLSAQDFVALEACSEFLITLRSIDASMLVFPAPTELAAVSSVVVPENRSAEVKQDFIIDSDVADPEIGSAVIAVVRDPVAKL